MRRCHFVFFPPAEKLAKVRVRRLPFYSGLLTHLGPVAARELTRHDDDDSTSVFERLHMRVDKDDKAGRRATTAMAHEFAREETKTSESSNACACAPDEPFQREVQTIQQALRRREALGVERWLQLQRCSARVDRLRCVLEQEN